MTPPCTTAAALGGTPHGFFGRRGGVSEGALASLNCGLGSGDDPALIAENRRRVAEAVLPEAQLTGLYQVHGDRCIIIDTQSDLAARPEADAMATRTPGILLGILTADCVPVLFADRDAGVVGAAHAGWKGAIAGVTDATLDAMEKLGARRDHIAAAIGPCIARASYEVDDAFVARFLSDDPANEHFFAAAPRPSHAMFDIAAYVAARIARAGVATVAIGGEDTYAGTQEYYSYRRACHRNENGYGRQLSVIGLAQR
ncbi:MAG: peptidoglycan editing factor PgeF [Sphingopyxis sp.]|uniref:peptidoglycan editing factor PgeF n=1 Tax=Sphingopyxis sp. TaxID=1908224 RepID=UPI002AB82CCB|nr:peptidoglycan editing factor PgeF [Sphingopyxis sp.]MDZ3833082.1 peptidoglycan editing factor PgeF [Sphingopyxis sp.]